MTGYHECNERCPACPKCYQAEAVERCRLICHHAVCPECESGSFTALHGCQDCGRGPLVPFPGPQDVPGETSCGWAGHRVGDVPEAARTAVCRACGREVMRLGKIYWTDMVDRSVHPLPVGQEDTDQEREGER